MTQFSNRPSHPRMDACSRLLIITVSFFTTAALGLAIVGILTPSWYYAEDANGSTLSHNLFVQCIGNVRNGSSRCVEIARQTDFGTGTLHAAALLIVAICLLGCGMFVTLAMNITRLTGILLPVAPILLFVAAIFMVACFLELSRVTVYNGYSAILVQTSHAATIFAAVLSAFVSGRLHSRFYERF